MNWISFFILLSTNIYSVQTAGNQSFIQVPNVLGYEKILKGLKADPNFPKVSSFGEVILGPSLETGSQQEDSGNLVKDYEMGVKKLLEQLPDSSLKNGLERYLEIINAQSYSDDNAVGASNAGIAAYNRNSLNSNPCFAKLVEAFYTEISTLDSEHYSKNYTASEGELNGRPSLSTESGKGDHEYLNPGWLYEKALEYSGDDPNLALNLIAVCGHDDTAHGMLRYKLEGSEQKNISKEDLTKILDYEIGLNGFISNSQTESFVEIDQKKMVEPYRVHIENLKKYKEDLIAGRVNPVIKNELERSIICPSKRSLFYLAKSLGNEVDLSEKDKDKIAMVQASSKGRAIIPSKNYHFMASAFMACQLIGKGVSPKMAVLIQKMAGWAYRTVRMNSILAKDLKSLEELEELYNKYTKNFVKENSKEVKTARGTRTKVETQPLSMKNWVIENKDLGLRNIEIPAPLGKEAEADDIQKWLTRLKAAREVSEMTLGGRVFGQEVPFSNITLNFVNDPVTRHIEGIDSNLIGRSRRAITSDRAVREKALTYLVDWDWTTKQHEIGASFAAKNCEKKPEDFKLDDKLCDTFADMPGVTCKIDYLKESGIYASAENGLFPGVNYSIAVGNEASGFTSFLEDVSSKMSEKYLEPNLNVEEKNGKTIFSGLY